MNLCGASILVLLAMVTSKVYMSPVTTPCGKPADVIFVIDTSSSIWPRDFDKYVLTFIQNVVTMFNVGPDASQTRVAAVTFSNEVKLEFNLNAHQNQEDVLSAISRIKFRGGNTYTDKALKYVTDNMFHENKGGRDGVAHIIVVLTDGKSSNNAKTIIEAENARRGGAAIFAIGVGDAEETELVQIASQPASQFRFKVTDFAALDSIKTELALKACEVNLPTTTTATTTTTTTQVPPVDECGGKPADIFFILDSSSSIWKVDFEKRVLGFVRDMVTNFDIGQDLTRVGVMTFNDSPRLVIGLDSYTSKQDLLNAITPRIVRYTLGGTNTAEALSDVRKIGFHESIIREGVAKIAIVITDGMSWNEKKTIREAELLKESGVKVYAIGVGKGVKQEELEAIANIPTEEFVFSVDDFDALSEIRDVLAVKACGYEGVQSEQPVCGSGPTDITFAFDASTLTVKDKHQILDQLQDVNKRLASIGGDVKIGVNSGPCPASMDFPLSRPDSASNKIRHIRRNLRSNLLGIIKQWRYKTVGDLKKSSSEEGITKYDEDSSFDSSKKGLVLLLNKDNVSEFNHIAEEILLLIDSGVDVMVVLDESVNKREFQKWIEMLGHRRVMSVDPDTDYSGQLMEYICSL